MSEVSAFSSQGSLLYILDPIFHISLLTKTDNPETTANEQIDDQEYEVERIVGKSINRGRTEYLIKWLGYENYDNSWEPVSNLFCPNLIQAYERKHHRLTDSNDSTSLAENELKGISSR